MLAANAVAVLKIRDIEATLDLEEDRARFDALSVESLMAAACAQGRGRPSVAIAQGGSVSSSFPPGGVREWIAHHTEALAATGFDVSTRRSVRSVGMRLDYQSY